MKTITPILIFLFSINLMAQLNSDRPGYSDPPQTVVKGSIQWENGFDFTFFDKNIDNNEINYLNSLIRFGISDFSEFRLSFAYKYRKDNLINLQGISDFGLGMKLKINESENSILPSSSLIMNVNLPYGSENFKPNKIEPILIMVFENPINEDFALGYNIGLNWNSSNIIYIYSLSCAYKINDKLNFTIGYLNELNEDEAPNQFVEIAFGYLLLNNLQIDLWTSYTPFNELKTSFISFGFSWQIN